MQPVDIFILLPILWGAFLGYQKGIVVEIISIIGFLLALYIGIKGYGWLTDYTKNTESPNSFNSIIPLASIGIIGFPLIYFINKMARMFRYSTKYTVFGRFDALIGAIVGSFTWALGMSAVLIFLNFFNVKIQENTTKPLILYPIVKDFAPFIIQQIKANKNISQIDTPFKKFI
ncbi:MAG: CvpA family protein [Pseudarcicella sp.]|nr:CvpA family protein [Pseudarcicella sp.]MBP6409726.1 CvpA family protein [Pseudarcicella sp.]